ncbi:unnamed protein product [Rhodiola kirilowii]
MLMTMFEEQACLTLQTGSKTPKFKKKLFSGTPPSNQKNQAYY